MEAIALFQWLEMFGFSVAQVGDLNQALYCRFPLARFNFSFKKNLTLKHLNFEHQCKEFVCFVIRTHVCNLPVLPSGSQKVVI